MDDAANDRAADEVPEADEPVWCTAKGWIDGLRMTATLTDDSLLMLYAGQPADETRVIPIDEIFEVVDQIGLLTGYITLDLDGEKIMMSRVPRDEARRLVEALRARLPRHPVRRSPATGAPAGGPSPLEELERLGHLRDSAVISEEEFQNAKETLLKRL